MYQELDDIAEECPAATQIIKLTASSTFTDGKWAKTTAKVHVKYILFPGRVSIPVKVRFCVSKLIFSEFWVQK